MTVKIIENIPVELDLQRLLSVLSCVESAEIFKEDAIWSIDTVASLSKPRLVVDYFKVNITQPDTLVVYSDNDSKLADLAIGARGVELMGKAKVAQISFITLGQEVQDLGEELHLQGEALKSYILDVAAILALKQAGQRANCLAEDRTNT